MIAMLDILQSIPVLSFLPSVMLAMVSLIPGRQLGIELGAIVLIFTGQVWNMAFSFYSSLKSLPRELREATSVYRFSAWQRFWQLELPYSAIGLVWNSMVSVAGGWFFLMACEMFVLGDRDFRLPGLGSFLQTAASTGDTHGMVWGSVTMILIIVATDQLVWRPVIAWADKFKFEQGESSSRKTSPILYMLRNSNALAWLRGVTVEPASERIYAGLARRQRELIARPTHAPRQRSKLAAVMLITAVALLVGFAAFRALVLLRQVQGAQFVELLKGADCAAAGADCRVLSGDGDFPYFADRAGSLGRWVGHWFDRADVAGHAVVHPVQRNCRSYGDSFESEGSGCVV